MVTRQDPVGRLQLALAGATGAAAGTMPAADRSSARVVIGSEHLLACLLNEDDAAEAALAGLAVTSRTAVTVLRRKHQAASWSVSEQAGDQPLVRLWEADLGLPDPRRTLLRRRRPREPMTVTPAVGRAVHRARAEQPARPLGVRDLLLALLAEDHTRAAEVLTELRTSPAGVRARLAETAHPAAVWDADPTLRFTRAMLLGQATYQPTSRGQRLVLKLMDLMQVNWAETPAAWAALVAQERAQRLGHPAAGSDDLLLAVLAVHAVAHAAPAVLPPDADRYYAGGDVLADFGVTYRRAVQSAKRMAATERRGGLDDADAEALRSLGIDLDQVVRHAERALRPGALAQERGTPAGRQLLGVGVEAEIAPRGLRNRLRGDPDIGSLALTAIRDRTRAARLLTELGVQPDQVRRRLQAITAAPASPDPTTGS